jgi:Ser/Thr protein kinase RdoA (MazF antagonist)
MQTIAPAGECEIYTPNHPMNTLNHLLNYIRSRYDLEPITAVAPLSGGEWKTLWRVDSVQATYVLTLSHPTTMEASVAYEHRLLHYLHAQLPEAPAPVLARDGSSYFVEQGRIVCLMPWMPGEMADGDDVHLIAARFLAHFHRVSVRFPDLSPRPGVPAWREWDWHAAAWPAIQAMLVTSPETQEPIGQRFWQSCGEWAAAIADRRQQIIQERSYFQQWIADLTRSARPLIAGLLHDDFHGGNLLMADGEVTALLDWDGCHPDWLFFELSNAIWEFCSDDNHHTLSLPAALAFLNTYAAVGGPIPKAEYDLIIPAIRCRRMIEILTALRGIATGEAWDESPDYLVHNLLALENLQTARL